MQFSKRNLSIILSFLLFLIILQSCQYRPFLKYYFATKKTHLPKFNEWDKFVGSNSNSLRSSYNVTCYDWLVHVYPDKKKIESSMKIYVKMDSSQDSIMLDLQHHLTLDNIKSSVPLKKTKRKKDILFIVFDRELQKGEQVMLEISYHGQPTHMLKNSAINWNKDKNNNPWICTATEGIGTHHMMPCKNLLSDEPDSCFIRLGVPKHLVGVSNGKLDGITETVTEKIYNWSVHNPINIYNISFNVGDYVKLEKKYKDINGLDRVLDIYPLSYNKTIADTFYDQAPVILEKFENLYGVYPWWKDGFKIIETKMPNGLCMEHQSGISMTDAYLNQFQHINLTLVHEISHEWWGNNVTAFDYADLWLHEGFAEHSEALFVEVHFGKKYYYRKLLNSYYSIQNKRPVVKPYGLRYNNLVHHDDQDIYGKGAMLIHTLRAQLNNDTLFFKTLKTYQQRFSKSNMTTDRFIAFFNEETKQDFTPLFDLYLRKTSPPILEYHLDKSNADTTIVEYNWAEATPVNFPMKISFWDGEKSNLVYPTSTIQKIKYPAKNKHGFDVIDHAYILVKERKK